MRRKIAVAAAVFVSTLAVAIAQGNPSGTGIDHPNVVRKITFRTEPSYPELAKKVHLQGIVKVEAVIRPNGSVKSTRVVGGNPVLVDAASAAVSKWKFEAAPSETTQTVEISFIPQ
jgi:TonB family protein